MVSDPPIEFLGVSDNVTALAGNRAMNRNSFSLPALYCAYSAAKIDSDIFPAA
jgi:hypothetical protein